MPKSVGTTKSGLVWTDKSLFRGVKAAAPAFATIIPKVMEYEATDAQNFMRTNAPWTDRTANARQGLFARYAGQNEDGLHTMVLYHTMPYGIWLEVKWAGKYKIIMPATEQAGRNVMKSLTGALSLLKGGGALG